MQAEVKSGNAVAGVCAQPVESRGIRIATSIPRQHWMQSEKLEWLDKAIAANPCDLFLTSQEFFGGGSCREINRQKGVRTDDVPVSVDWITSQIGALAQKHNVHIGLGATVDHDGIFTEDYTYISPFGEILGYHSKIALPVQDSIITNGASKVTPEVDFERACTPIELPLLGIKVGTVFCWQVYFNHLWQALKDNGCNLVVNCIKWAPRGWYAKGENLDGEGCRVGFTQEKGGDDPESDALGWIRKLKYESEFKEMPIAVTCNTWAAGAKYLALCGFVDEVLKKTELFNQPSVPETDFVHVHAYDPSLYDELDHLSLGVYAQFKENWPTLMQGTMKRKAVRIERRCINGRIAEQLAKWRANPPRVIKKKTNDVEPFEAFLQEA